MIEWQPIETADKEANQDVLLWDGKRVVYGSYYPDIACNGPGWFAEGEADAGDPIKPTHWMPLPSPPTTNQPRSESAP